MIGGCGARLKPGDRNNSLTIVSRLKTVGNKVWWNIRCDCGEAFANTGHAFLSRHKCTKCVAADSAIKRAQKARQLPPSLPRTKRGVVTYEGAPCRHGHGSTRYTSTRACVVCMRIRSAAFETSGKRKRDPDERLRAQRKYLSKKENRQLHVSHIRRRRALQRQADGEHTGADIARLFDLQGGKCAYCRRSLKKYGCEADHIEPLSRGGSNAVRNIQLACRSCNAKKNAKPPLQFAREIGLLL